MRDVIPACALAVLLGCAPPDTGPPPPEAVVVEVIDGDTVLVRTGPDNESVRLIGIDTPEVAHHGNPDECFGPEAAARAAQLLPVGSTVRLVRDVEARDIYDRLLAYVFNADGTLINLQLAAEGFARELSIAPNTAIADDVAAAVSTARSNGLGLWSQCSDTG